MVDLLGRRHQEGRRFQPAEFIEEGIRVAVRLSGGSYKVFTFGGSGEQAVLLQDCVDRDDALRYLAAE